MRVIIVSWSRPYPVNEHVCALTPQIAMPVSGKMWGTIWNVGGFLSLVLGAANEKTEKSFTVWLDYCYVFLIFGGTFLYSSII